MTDDLIPVPAPIADACPVRGFTLDLEQDADRVCEASHVEELAMGATAVVLRVWDAAGCWIRTLVEDDDRASWVAA